MTYHKKPHGDLDVAEAATPAAPAAPAAPAVPARKAPPVTDGAAFFCVQCGVRIAQPDICDACKPNV